MIPGASFVPLVAAGGPAPQVERLGPVIVTRIASPQLRLVFEVRVPAPRDSVWAAYEYLAQGNAQLLGQLHHPFVRSPIDWAALGRRDMTGAGH